jgi:hypothetical protein
MSHSLLPITDVHKLKIRVIAFYLPQYHPIPENDEWWGPGFTEWRHVVKARPLFKGHKQPKLPADLGFYDLRVQEVRQKQAKLAQSHGIEGFIYWHYWHGNGRRLLERPFNEVLNSGEPNFPFCLAWANHDWTGTAFGAGNRLLAKQTYPGWDDYSKHFEFLKRAFLDRRYIRVDGKPLLYIYKPKEIPECKKVMEFWRLQAVKAGFEGLHIVAEGLPKELQKQYGFDASLVARHRHIDIEAPRRHNGLIRFIQKPLSKIGVKLKGPIQRFPYKKAIQHMLQERYESNEYPHIVPNWDTTPRLGKQATIFENATPELFEKHVREAISKVKDHPDDHRIVFLRSWNEWAEGNYIEPDEEYGMDRLNVLKKVLAK